MKRVTKLFLLNFIMVGLIGNLWADNEQLSSEKASKILQIEYQFMQSGNYPLTPEGLDLESFTKSQLVALSQELRHSGVMIFDYPTKNINSTAAAALARKHQKETEEYLQNETEENKLVGRDYAKLSWVLAKNSAIAVTDIYTSGAGGKVIKLTSKSKYVWWAKEVSKLNKIAKLKVLMDSKKYKYFVKIIETGFDLEQTYQDMKAQNAIDGQPLAVDMNDFINYFQSQGIEILEKNGVMVFVNEGISQDILLDWAQESVVTVFQEIAQALNDALQQNLDVSVLDEVLKNYAKAMVDNAISMTPVLSSFVDTWKDAKVIADRTTPEAYALAKNYFDVTLPQQQLEWDNLHKKTMRERIAYTIELAYINYPKEVFEDVSATDWYFNYVNTLIEKKAISTQNRKFNPMSKISQYEFLVISSRLFFSEDIQGYMQQNTNIDKQKLYFDFITAKLGTITNINFINKDKPINRGEVAEILHKILYLKKYNKQLPYYADGSFSGTQQITFSLGKTYFGTLEPSKGWYYHPAFLRAVNISHGYKDGTYGLNNNIRRSEAAVLLVGSYNFMEAN